MNSAHMRALNRSQATLVQWTPQPPVITTAHNHEFCTYAGLEQITGHTGTVDAKIISTVEIYHTIWQAVLATQCKQRHNTCCSPVSFSHYALSIYRGFMLEKRFWFLSLCRCILFFTCLSISSSSIDGISSYECKQLPCC